LIPDFLNGEINMMAAIFIWIFIAVLFAWRGQRSIAIYCVTATLLMALVYFHHDITEHLKIQL
jgi:hypothetical protein